MVPYFRPLVQFDQSRPADALTVAGGAGWCAYAERLHRSAPPEVIPVVQVPEEIRTRISTPRADVAGLSMDAARIMGILNVTPDSFSDGGSHDSAPAAVRRALELVGDGADMIDVGGESTRPGAQTVAIEAEIARTEPVIRALRHNNPVPISIDTRKTAVAEAAHLAGASLVNDVSGFTYDKALGPYCARKKLPVCVMHASGDPETMQNDPRYDNALLDVYDFLAAQIILLEGIGIPRDRIWVDPGIGFGKTQTHNLEILNRISLFHSLGCPILLGVSRKKFIGALSGVTTPAERVMGSVSVALAAVAQGVQVLRVHDVRETRQALDLWSAVQRGA